MSRGGRRVTRHAEPLVEVNPRALRAALAAKGWSITELATQGTRVRLGLGRAALGHLCTGTRTRTRLSVLERLAVLLDTTPKALREPRALLPHEQAHQRLRQRIRRAVARDTQRLDPADHAGRTALAEAEDVLADELADLVLLRRLLLLPHPERRPASPAAWAAEFAAHEAVTRAVAALLDPWFRDEAELDLATVHALAGAHDWTDRRRARPILRRSTP